MSWATVSGLAIILGICTLAAALWTAHCKALARNSILEQIDEKEKELNAALKDDESNLIEHLRLRESILRLRKQLADI